MRLAAATGLVTFGATIGLSTHSAHAQDISWNNTNGGSWSLGSNWTGPNAPGTLTGAGLFAKISTNITTDRTIALDGNKTVGRLDIGDSTVSNEFIIGVGTIAGSSLIFDSGNATVAAQLNELSTANGDSITAGVLLNSSLNFNNQTTNKTFSFMGTVGANASGPVVFTNLGNAGAVAFTGVVSDGTVSGGTLAIVQAATVSSSVLTLSNTASVLNTFTGGVTVNQGIVLATTTDTTTNALRALGTGTVNLNGGTLQLRSNGTGVGVTITTGNGTTGNNVAVSGANTIDVNRTSANSGSAIAINNLTLATGSTLNVTGGNTYRLLVAGSTSLGGNAAFSVTTAPLVLSSLTAADSVTPGDTAWATFSGTGAVTVSSVSNNGSDPTKKLGLVISGSPLVLNTANTFTGGVSLNSGTLTFANGALTGNTINAAGGTLQWLAGNNQDLGGTINALSGTTTLDLGTNNVTLAGANALTGTGTLTKLAASTGVLTLNGANSFSGIYNTANAGGVTVLGNSNALQNATVNIVAANKLTFANGIGTVTLGALTGSVDNLLADAGSNPITLQLSGTAAGATYSGKLGTTASSLVKIGTGTQTLSGANTFSGGTLIKSGALVAGAATGLGTGGITLGDAAGSSATLAGGNFTMNNALTVASGAAGTLSIANTGSSSLVLAGNVALNHDLVLAPIGTGSARLGGTITGSGNIMVNGDAGATAALSAANTAYSGTTSLNSGTLSIQNANALGSGSLVINGGSLSTNAVTTLASTPLLANGSFGFTSTVNNTLLFAGGPVTFGSGAPVTVSVTASTLTFGGTSSGSLIKDGAGTLRLWGTNGISGFTVAAGTLTLGKPVLPSNFLVSSGATLGLNLGGAGEFTGSDLTALDGNPGFASGSLLGADTTNATTPITVSGALTSPGMGFNKLGTGTLVLTADHTFSGVTQVTAGVLQLGVGGATGSVAGPVTVGTNTQLNYNRSGTVAIGNLFSGAGSVNFSGPGTFTLTNLSNSFTGGIGIYGGATYSVSAGSFLPTGTIAMGGIANPSGVPSNLAAGNLNITEVDVTASRFNVTSGSGTNTVTIGVGRTFTISNAATGVNFLIGTSNGPSGPTLIDFVGGGNLVINTPNAPVYIGLRTQQLGSGTPGFSSTVTDMTGLANFTATADVLHIGNVGQGTTNVLRLASGVNTINANTVQFGGGKSDPTLTFAGANGSLIARAVDGASPVANFNIMTNPGGSSGGVVYDGFVQLNGHNVDIQATTMTIAVSDVGNAVNAYVSYNQGTISATTLLIAQKPTSTTKATGYLTISGGALNIGTGGINLASAVTTGSAEGRLSILGTGVATTNGDITRSGTTATASVVLNGGTLNMLNHNIGASGNTVGLTLQSGTLLNVAEVNGGSGITKTTGGTLTIGGTNTYTGGTSVAAGTLVVNGTITGATGVASTATLGGSGTTGAVNIATGGTLAPGNSPGTINTGNLNVDGNLSLDLASAASYDQVNVTGTVDVDGANLVLALSGNTLAADDLLFVIKNDDADAVTGTFATLNGTGGPLTEGSQINASGILFTITYAANAESPSFIGGNDIGLRVDAVPEPTTLGLLALGATGLLARRRRRKA